MINNIRERITSITKLRFALLLAVLAMVFPLNLLAQTYTRKGFKEMGITLNTKVYTINAVNTSSDPSSDFGRGSIIANTNSTLGRTNSPSSSDANQQFVFVTYTDADTSSVYLYSVGQKKFAKSNLNLVDGNASYPNNIYVYPTNNTEYKFALAFNANATFGTTSAYRSSGVLNISGGRLQVLSYSQLDNGNRWNIQEVTTATFSNSDLAAARATLRNTLGYLKGPLHYRGASGRAFKANGMQDVSEVNYYYYVDRRRRQYGTKTQPDSAAVDLQLPFKRYLARSYDNNHTVLYKSTTSNYSGSPDVDHASNGNPYEPMGYIRWYNYSSDSKMNDSRLIPWTAGDNNMESSADQGSNILSTLYDQNGKALGLVAHGFDSGIMGPDAARVGTAYVIPTEANDSTWAGDTIACDVSFYTDFNVPMKDDGTIDGDYSNFNQDLSTFSHEPTLTTRYVYHILPAKRLANQFRTALLTPVRGHTSTMADRGVFSFGAKDEAATMSLRIPLPDVPYFYFWPLDDANTHHVYHKVGDATHAITSGNFEASYGGSNEPVEAKYIEYRVYSADSTHWRTIGTATQQKMMDISINLLNGDNVWYDLDNKQANGVPKITIGSSCFIVGYAVGEDQSKKCPFFNVRLDITNNKPLSADSLKTGRYPNRVLDYMQAHFGSPIAQFTFDSENEGQTLTSATGNFRDVSNIPYDFSKRDYSFLYLRDLIGFGTNGNPLTSSNSKFRRLSYNNSAILLHGDYDLVKEMTIDGTNAYDMLHDREPSQYGYFMVTDASDESRALGEQDFQGSLCSGSQIIVSAWIRNTSSGRFQENKSDNNVNAAPELRFTLLGVRKDQNNNDISTKEFAALCTGDFATNIKGFVNGTSMDAKNWYQVFGTITLPDNSGIENYTDFRVVIDNFCKTADGADYAIDDIFVYQSNSKLEVIQDPALCNDTEVARNNVKIKIRANYNTARQMTGAENGDKKVYYRFCMPDVSNRGIPVTGHDFYGAGMDTCGVAIIPQDSTAYKTLGAGYGDDANSPKFESDAAGVTSVILINKSFNLRTDSTYYVSLALDNGSGQPGTWGLPSNLCSSYSGYFQLVRQNIYFKGTETTTRQIMIPCGSNSSTTYSGISAAITAPSHLGTGSVALTGQPFYWFIGSAKTYKSIHDKDSLYLETAVHNYASKYPGKPFNADNAVDPDGTVNGYTQACKNLIQANLYSSSNTNGKLLMSAVDTLGTIPLSIGRDTITAVVAADTVTVNGIRYTMCPDPMELFIQVSHDGPGLTFGMKSVTYPTSDAVRNIRIGIPQLKKMYNKENITQGGILSIPVKDITYEGTSDGNESLTFLGTKDDITACDSVYISYTNDPSLDLFNSKQTYFGKLTSTTLPANSDSLTMYIANYSMLHEGYEYTLMFKFRSPEHDTGGTSQQCPGESYIRLRIVPEYVTWEPTVDNGLNSNWNNDGNWRRSTAGELFNADYTDYRHATYQFTLHDEKGNAVAGKTNMWNIKVDKTLPDSTLQPASFVPMYFTKVIIPTMQSQRYPMLGYIAHQASNGLAQNLMNYKQHDATTNIRYDMMAAPFNRDSTSYKCVVFDGNICEQIHFKTGAQLRNEQYLNYQRAWTELELPINSWGTFTTPMDHSIAGDMYVPKVTGRQETPLFTDIRFIDVDKVDENGVPDPNGSYGLYGKAGDTMYNRVRMPVYQKLWAERAQMQPEDTTETYSSYDSPYIMLIYPTPEDPDMSMHPGVNANNFNAWSHTFNFVGTVPTDSAQAAVNGVYVSAYGLAGKIGDGFAKPSETVNPTQTAVMRLPKADTSFTYFKTNGGNTVSPGEGVNMTMDVTQLRRNNYRLGVQYNPVENDLGVVRLNTAILDPYPSLAYIKGSDSGQRTAYGDTIPEFIKDAHGNVAFNKNAGDYSGIDKDRISQDTTSVVSGMIYDLVGNPYTSAISVREFINGNRDIMRTVERNGQWVYRIWSLIGDQLYEYNDSNINTVIQPGQSFFIMLQRPYWDQVVFTTRMQTDPNITYGGNLARVNALTPAPAKIYTINDNTDMTNIINHGIDSHLYVWSPSSGILAVSGERIRRIEIYNISGQLVRSDSFSGSEKQYSIASGIYIVKATLNGGSSQSQKIAVR